jgi:hypothetical protein
MCFANWQFELNTSDLTEALGVRSQKVSTYAHTESCLRPFQLLADYADRKGSRRPAARHILALAILSTHVPSSFDNPKSTPAAHMIHNFPDDVHILGDLHLSSSSLTPERKKVFCTI